MQTNESPKFTMRPGYYIRKRDGYRVVAADWQDGDVSGCWTRFR
ncbi:hypothetical protein [Rhizobium sp. CECT 9324]|nr:hypothetical protein [Rhizobium sp. CECT 9324]CAH0343706.1 hypothetical protein RHI9324_05443 [Rhizobium sp. CECT 9324]